MTRHRKKRLPVSPAPLQASVSPPAERAARLRAVALAAVVLAAIVAGSDTGAYYAGRAFGHRKLFPEISPKKTVAGGIGGLGAGMLAALLVGFFAPTPINIPALSLCASLLVVVGIGGDLTESVIKRAVGVKDSGAILFGHGGVLDRIDSLLLAGPVLYYLLHFDLLG